MDQYKFVEENGMGVLKKKVHQKGQPDTWEEDMKTPLPAEPVDEQYVNQKIAQVVDTIAIADQTNGDITIQYDDGQEDNNEE